ncbi:MAG TPA: glycoside hydrolase family 19 protein [Acetobacteraceae bacterium]|jgi:putative chitinase|nr:glycoside hydrolase family 19 protein [Acetobacteraceae bacterium]
MDVTLGMVQQGTAATEANAAKYADSLIAAMTRFDINAPNRVSAFLATVAIESDHLNAVEENLYYSNADHLAATFPGTFHSAAEAEPYTKNPKALSEKRYEGFHGRGLIQLTWKSNYQAAGDAIGADYVGNPGLLCQPEHAALSAAWFWSSKGCNAAADDDDMDKVTEIVNGKAKLKLSERVAQYDANKTAFA